MLILVLIRKKSSLALKPQNISNWENHFQFPWGSIHGRSKKKPIWTICARSSFQFSSNWFPLLHLSFFFFFLLFPFFPGRFPFQTSCMFSPQFRMQVTEESCKTPEIWFSWHKFGGKCRTCCFNFHFSWIWDLSWVLVWIHIEFWYEYLCHILYMKNMSWVNLEKDKQRKVWGFIYTSRKGQHCSVMIDDNSDGGDDGEKDEDVAGTVGNAGSINRPLLHSRTDKSFLPPSQTLQDTVETQTQLESVLRNWPL